MKITTFNKLRKYESYLYTAHKADYIRSLRMSQLEELMEAGAEIDIIYKYNHCPKCVLDFVKKLAVKYFEQKNKMEENRNAKTKKKSNADASGSAQAPDNGGDSQG